MKSKRIVFRVLAYALEVVLLWVLQSTPKLMPEVLGGRPFLLLAAALGFAVNEDVIPALIWGAVCGVLADLSAGGTVGWFAFSFTLACFAAASLLDTYLTRNPLTAGVLALGAVIAVLGLYFLFFRVFAGIPGSVDLFVKHYLSRMIYTYVCFFPLYFLDRFLHKVFA